MKKFSKQRELILKTVLSSNEHLTADNIYDRLKESNPNLSLGTVYRNLTQLEEHGYIKKINIPGDPVRFDGNTEEHHHFICEKCGKIFDIEDEKIEYVDKLSETKGFKVNSMYLILRGVCDECSSEDN